MHPPRSIRPRPRLASPLALQAIIALAALMFALSPANGGTAIFLPIHGGGMAGTVAWSRDYGASLVAPGPYDGAFFIRTGTRSSVMAALAHGALLISVPEFLCGNSGPNMVATKQ